MNLDLLDIFVPGRLCILGEHSDWAAEYRDRNKDIPIGYTLVCATNQGISAKIGITSDCILHFKTTIPEKNINSLEISLLDHEKFLEMARSGGLYSYVCGTTYIIINHPSYQSKLKGNNSSNGIYIDNYQTTLPIKKGLSSSAAICVLVTQSFNQLFGLELDADDIMNIAYQGEMLTPSQCGRMDQCVVMGANTIAVMEFYGCYSCNRSNNSKTSINSSDGNNDSSSSSSSSSSNTSYTITSSTPSTIQGSCSTNNNQIHDSDDNNNNNNNNNNIVERPCKLIKLRCKAMLYFVVVDLMSSKDTIEILRQLNHCFPIPNNPTQQLFHKYIQENELIIEKAIVAIESGDSAQLGHLMTQSQDNFDLCATPNCPSQLQSPILHTLIYDLMNEYNKLSPNTKNSILSVKGVGSQGDGSAQILCISQQSQQHIIDYIEKKYHMNAFSLTISPTSSE